MRYAIEKTDDVVVARIHGDMWGKPEDRELKTELNALAKQGERRFVIDFEGASAVSSTGIGIVVSSLTPDYSPSSCFFRSWSRSAA